MYQDYTDHWKWEKYILSQVLRELCDNHVRLHSLEVQICSLEEKGTSYHLWWGKYELWHQRDQHSNQGTTHFLCELEQISHISKPLFSHLLSKNDTLSVKGDYEDSMGSVIWCAWPLMESPLLMKMLSLCLCNFSIPLRVTLLSFVVSFLPLNLTWIYIKTWSHTHNNDNKISGEVGVIHSVLSPS